MDKIKELSEVINTKGIVSKQIVFEKEGVKVKFYLKNQNGKYEGYLTAEDENIEKCVSVLEKLRDKFAVSEDKNNKVYEVKNGNWAEVRLNIDPDSILNF